MSEKKYSKDLYYAKKGKITTPEELLGIEQNFRKFPESEFVPFARNASLLELINLIKDKGGSWKNPLYIMESKHITTIGVDNLIRKANEFLLANEKEHPMDVLSITAGVDEDQLTLQILIRSYSDNPVKIRNIFKFKGSIWSDECSNWNRKFLNSR